MAPAYGRESADLSELLLREPYRFDFFQAVRLLERLALGRGPREAGRRRGPVGRDLGPDEEVVRFRALPSPNFPPAPVVRVAPRGRGRAPGVAALEMVVGFLGLTGPLGVLPPHYATLLLRRIRDKDYALRDFLDLFNHRTISLFYRAWEKYRLPFAYERSRQEETGEEAGGVGHCLYSLVGLGTDGLRGRTAVADETFLFYAGHFAHHPRSAIGLESLLQDYFDVPVRVHQAQGQWLRLEEADRSLLPGPDRPRGLNCQLGRGLVVGERVWDVQSKFRLVVGPMTYAQFRRHLPDGDGLKALRELTRTYVGPEFDFDVLLLLRPEEAPLCRLSSAGAVEQPRLGWNTWVRGEDLERIADDAVFDAEDM